MYWFNRRLKKIKRCLTRLEYIKRQLPSITIVDGLPLICAEHVFCNKGSIGCMYISCEECWNLPAIVKGEKVYEN